MQPVAFLEKVLQEHSSPERFVYAKADLRNLFPGASDESLNMILSRSVRCGVLARVCKGIYLYEKGVGETSTVLYKVAAKLRGDCMNYISLETVLCEHSLISQQLLGWITVMTTGRSGIIGCGRYGTVEFVHTAKDFASIEENLFLDTGCGMLKANPAQAYRDMIDAKRAALDLVNVEEVSREQRV